MSNGDSSLPQFEFDEAKSCSNKAKHGIDFVEARSGYEVRFLVIGRIGRRHWSAVVSIRGQRVRLISVRRSRLEEVIVYESQRV
jgi:uncharacterized DUF497 family protein